MKKKSTSYPWVISAAIAIMLILSGCSLLDRSLKKTVDPETGSISLPGLASEVTVRRDELGIPVVEAQNIHDLTYATGYVMASDRLAQMVTFSLLAQGRLSEMVGPVATDMVYFEIHGPGAVPGRGRF